MVLPMQKSVDSTRLQAVKHKYGQVAKDYDTRWSFYVATTIEETIKRIDPKPGNRLLDIGCGTGALLEVMASRFPKVSLVGIDLSPAMLAVALDKCRQQVERSEIPRSGVKLVGGLAQQLPFCSASFDIVVSCNSFHYWQTPDLSLAEIERVLRPGGRLVITDWCDDYLACKLCDLFLKFVSRAHYRTYDVQECRELLEHKGYTVVSIERYKINWLWGIMTARANVDKC